MKVLAVTGFTAVIALLVWLAITLVAALPSAFSSLASIAEGLQQARPHAEIVIANNNSIVNNGESFTVTWTNLNRNGVYTLYYECVDGVAIDMRYPANYTTPVPCGEVVKLGSEVTSLELVARSEKKRFIDVAYQIGFMPAGGDEVAYQTETAFTVVNVNIPQSQSVEDTTETPAGEVAGETTDTTEEEETTPATTPLTPGEPEVIATEIFELPTSDPDGFVDLAVKYVSVGRLASNNQFIPGGVIAEGTRGAFQFEVRNLGTKTSEDWTFEAELTSGTIYESKKQEGLLPNEYTLITIGFDTVGDTGAQSFGAEIDVPGDRNASNNSFSWAVNIVD
mgnify:CR=1 FL=1|tara:strand:+ start:2410 stop:3420 length:1011 start_codon:yes stop_codon:yes gene_type:complete